MRFLIILTIALSWTAAEAQTSYRWVDPATGRTMITDTPPPRTVKQVEKSSIGESDTASLPPVLKRAVENFPVTLYTSPDCPDECKQARALLNSRGVPFTEKVLRKPEDFAELKAVIGDLFVPSIKVGKQTSRGFQAETYNKLLDLAGYPTTAPYGSKPVEAAPAQK